MNPKAREHRYTRLREMLCIACTLEGMPQPMFPEIHHLNGGGHAGQKRRGDEFTIPLCPWHHQGRPPDPMTTIAGAYIEYGPSLKHHSRQFREKYGSDDYLLTCVNIEIEHRDRIARRTACS